jgi:hypothetical protein
MRDRLEPGGPMPLAGRDDAPIGGSMILFKGLVHHHGSDLRHQTSVCAAMGSLKATKSAIAAS